MPTIYSYQKYIDSQISRTLRLPEDGQHQWLGTELATIDGLTYVSLPDGVALPTEQPAEIAASIKTVVLDATLTDAIKAASPHYALINARVLEQIRTRYSASDELQCLRLAPSPDTTAWNAWVEDCCSWGRTEKAKLGL